MKKFVLKIEHSNGSYALLVNTPDLVSALQLFQKLYRENQPDSKEYGFPTILKAELLPISYDLSQDKLIKL